MRTPVLTVLAAATMAITACGGSGGDSPAGPETPAEPKGAPLSTSAISALAEEFSDDPLTGGQSAPRLYKWVNDDVALFLQFDNPDPAQAKALRYIGISVKGVFCAEDRPGGKDGGFPHFHRLDASDYAKGHGGKAGTPGYWLSWVAVDSFTQRDGRQVRPGVDYDFSPTPEPPECGKKKAKADFDGPGAGPLAKDDIARLAGFFEDQPLTGGQTAPRLYKWVNENVSIFLQFDNPDIGKAKELRYVGISSRGEFCKSKRPGNGSLTDFPHFHRTNAAEYAKGHGQAPGDRGYWLLWVATDSFKARDGRAVTPGVDREFSPTPPPGC